jgi:LuxR family transcriptional regulator, maltose regulon positive regulatory protein
MVGERPSLTPREYEILELTAAGRSAPDIARLLDLSPASVRRQLLSLFGKLGVTDRSGAVREASRFQLLD